MITTSGRHVVLAVVGSVVLAFVLFLASGANPFEAMGLLVQGSIGSPRQLSTTLLVWIPLTLAAASLVITFSAGLWNIGVEGQIVLGAIGATWVARSVGGPGWAVIPLAMIVAVVAGSLWAMLAGLLKLYGGVNEIFGGLGLDFVATGFATYLIIGPWKRDGIASTSGTELFREDVWLPTIGGENVSWVALTLVVLAVIAVVLLMSGTSFGLKLKAVGTNLHSATRLGIPANRYLLVAFALGGSLAGLAGSTQVLGFTHKLVPSVSGGFGFLGILVVLLAGFRPILVAPIAFFFAAITVGTTFLELRIGVDSSVGGVLQGLLVLFVLLSGGWLRRRQAMAGTGPPEPAVPTPSGEVSADPAPAAGGV